MDRQVRVAVVGDLHIDGSTRGYFRQMITDICREADILALCGDLTTHGTPDQAHAFLQEVESVNLPIVAVLGNHDYESGMEDAMFEILRDRGIHVLDGTNVEIEGVGFAGVKGFGGGFGRGTLGPFGEKLYKDFVQAAIDESLKLETALRTLRTEIRVALLHYSPIPETLEGEPPVIFPFLGSSRLLPPLEIYGTTAIFHGHAHRGAPEGRTPGGVPVYNVAHMLLRETTGKPYRIWTVTAPDRRQRDE